MKRMIAIAAVLAYFFSNAAQAQGTSPGLLQPGQILGNNGPIAGVSGPISVGLLTPEQFGCVGDGTTNNTSCFASLAAYVNASAPGATIQFKPNANYAVWPTDPGSAFLMQFIGTNGLTINFNGAKITSAMSSSVEENYVLGFTGTNSNITINDPHYEQTAFGNTTPSFGGGGILIWLSDNATNVIVNNLYEVGALGGIHAVRTSANRASNIVLNGAYFSSVYYPLNFRKNGDNFTGSSIYATNVGRMYFPYNVKHHRVQFTNNYVANVIPTVLIGLVTLSTESADLNTTADIRVDATFTSSAPLTSGIGYADINFEQGDATSTPGTVKDIYYHIIGTANGIGTVSNAFVIHKANFSGSSDTATRGYVLENIELSGKLDWGYGNVQTASLFNTGDIWTASGGTSSIAARTNSFTGSIAGTTLTASAVTGTIYPGTQITGATISGAPQILAQLTGTPGGAGTYSLATSQTAASTAVSGTYGLLTVGGSVSGTFAVGDILSGTGVAANTYITALGSGTGGAGTYAVSNNTVVGSTSIAGSDVVRNITFRDLVAINSIASNSITATLTNLQGPFDLQNVTVDQPIALTGATAANGTTSYQLFFPAGAGANGQVLQSQGPGSPTIWGAGGGGTPCTTTANSIQYNNAGAFGCVSTSTWNGLNLTLGGLNESGANGGTVAINGGNVTSASTTFVGGDVNITAGSSDTWVGGNATLTGGSSGSETGGTASVTGGASTSGGAGQAVLAGGNTVSGFTGSVDISGGNGQGVTGGAVNISGGADTTGTNGGGQVTISGGIDQGAGFNAVIIVAPNANGAGGVVDITAGDSTGVNGAHVEIQAGGSDTQNGGNVELDGGNSTSGTGGPINLFAGNSATGVGGQLLLQAGNATAGSAAGGNVTIQAGTSFGGTAGKIQLVGIGSSVGTNALCWNSSGGAVSSCSFPVSSVSNSDGTLTISPTTGAVVASLALGHANTWTAVQTFTNSDIKLLGSSTGATTFTSANSGASNFTLTFPAATDTLADLAGTQTFTNKTIAFASNTLTGVAPLAAPVFTGATIASGSFQVGSATPATLATGEFDLAKISASGSAPGAGNLKIEAVAGTDSGSCKIIAYAGTSSTPVTIVDNVGAGC